MNEQIRPDHPERAAYVYVVRGTAGQEVVWRLPTDSRIRQILRNPQYAGAFAYGRTGTTTVKPGERIGAAARTARQRRRLHAVLGLSVDQLARRFANNALTAGTSFTGIFITVVVVDRYAASSSATASVSD